MIKFLLSMSVFAVWGPYLVYVFMLPTEVPEWARVSGFRRALMLDTSFEPTLFTLLFGIGFIGLVIWGVTKALRGEAEFQKNS